MRIQFILLLKIAMLLTTCSTLPSPAPTTSFTDSATDFHSTLEFDSVSFLVSSPNADSGNTITIQPAGMVMNEAIVTNINGRLYAAAAGDLNKDGFPELYCSIANQDGTGKLIAFGSNKNKSLTPIYIPDIIGDKVIGAGYMGNDGFSIDSFTVNRSFPVYLSKDPVAAPTGGVRTIRYQLVAGEAGWVLRPIEIKDIK